MTAGNRLREWTKTVVVALVIFLAIRTLLIEGFHIPSGSMENTLLIGDVLFVNKALYGAEIPFIHKRLPAFRAPRRDDLVIFQSVDTPGLTVVKRVIGMPGDTLSMRKDVLYRDGVRQEEPYVIRTDPFSDPADPKMRAWQRHYLASGDPATYRPTEKNWGPLVVPPDSYFVMGDNRDESYDSRYWGFLGRDRIRGRPLIIYYSYNKNGVLPLPFLTAIRWKRILSLPK